MGDLVWYVAYGSNLGSARLQRWLDQCRDPAPPRADRAVTIGHGLWFGGESVVWGGGRAYVDHVLGGETLARAWLLTRQQWADLHGLESGRDADDLLDPACVVSGECRSVGGGRYDVLVGLGAHDDDVPMVTFTGPSAFTPDAARRPAPDYVRAIAVGLREAHGLSVSEVADYLLVRPGADQWSADELRAALDSSV